MGDLSSPSPSPWPNPPAPAAAVLSTHACDLCACFWLPAAGHLSKGEDKTSKTMENTQQRIQDNGKETGLGEIFQLNLLRLLSGFI